MTRTLIVFGFVWISSCHCFAQQDIPSVRDLIASLDTDKDSRLSAEEVAESRYKSQFPRWDANGDGLVDRAEIVAFRARFGIAEDGTRLRPNAPRRSNQFRIPDPGDLQRVDRDNRPVAESARNSEFVLATTRHEPIGDKYVLLTDHSDEEFLEPLQRLATFREGQLLVVGDLGQLGQDEALREGLKERLQDAKYVAIAPKPKSFRENMLLGAWQMLSSLDDDPQIDVYPGILLAPDAESMRHLVHQTIEYESLASSEIRPFALSQVQNSSETRSLQKAGILRKFFAQWDQETPTIAIYGPNTSNAPRLDGEHSWEVTLDQPRQTIKELPRPAEEALSSANLIVMHGHGVPGMSCSLDVDGLPSSLAGKILMTGSCFSASPIESDLPNMTQAPGGYRVEQRDAFVMRAMGQGAVVAFGHQRLSSGFPHLFPVLESWTKGATVGQAYQELLNSLIEYQPSLSGNFILEDPSKAPRRLPQNSMLYVVIGDPALQPFQTFEELGDEE